MTSKEIIYRPCYITPDEVTNVRNYFDVLGDSLQASKGPYPVAKAKLGYQGCWDRTLHLELCDNPVHSIITKLKKDFGEFEIECSSIRYLSAPFLPHSDIKGVKWIQDYKTGGRKEGFIFIIPLWWHNDYQPGTAFFNSPANINEPLYSELEDILPQYANEHVEESRNFSVKQVIKWESPGDLICWRNFQWHSSCHFGEANYSPDTWVKEFISIETYFKG